MREMNATWTAAGIGLLGFSTGGKEIHFSPLLCPHFSSILIWSHYFVSHLPGSKSNNILLLLQDGAAPSQGTQSVALSTPGTWDG